MFLKFFNIIRNILAVIGLLSCVFGLVGLKYVLDSYQLTPHQLALKLTHKAGIESPWVTNLLRPKEKHSQHQLVGSIRNDVRPRIIFKGTSEVKKLRNRYREDAVYRKQVGVLGESSDYLPKAVAWTAGGNQRAGFSALKQLQTVGLTSVSAEGSYGNGLELALAYDLLSNLPVGKVEDKQLVAVKLRRFLNDALTVLDGNSASLWHGRMQLSSSAWVAAVALGTDNPADVELVTRVQAHFHESLSSIELTEGWPEGYSYWINNRAYPFVLACLAHLNGVDAATFNDRVRTVLERVGMWMIHGVEPQGRFHLFADSGPRNDLKDETQRVIDLIYMATGKPVFKYYSRYLSSLHGREAYYRYYRWALPLFRGLIRDQGALPISSLEFFDQYLSVNELFGRDTFGQLFARSDWSDSATFLSFKTGHNFTHHGHYQAGHFTLNKAGEPLALSSGTYGKWDSPHRLHYYIRTVSSNSLLVQKPEEKVAPNRFFTMNVAAGGQRIVMPTGSAINSIADWRKNIGQGRHYEGGSIKAFETRDDTYVFVSADLTPAYNSTIYDESGDIGKVEDVNRKLVYLPDEDMLLIYDRVTSTEPGYTKKWLLHTATKPRSDNEELLIGDDRNGILLTSDKRLFVEGLKSSLTIFPMLPENSLIRKVGGVDYRYYVEIDGDDSRIDGLNMDIGSNEQPWFDSGLWRIEIQPKNVQKTATFLVALVPRVKGDEPVSAPRLVRGLGVDGLVIDKLYLLFSQNDRNIDQLQYHLNRTGGSQVVFGVEKEKDYVLFVGNRKQKLHSSNEGVLEFDLTGIPAGSEVKLVMQ